MTNVISGITFIAEGGNPERRGRSSRGAYVPAQGLACYFLVSLLDLPSSLLFYEKKESHCLFLQGFQQVIFQHTVSLQRDLFPRYCAGFHWAFTSLGVVHYWLSEFVTQSCVSMYCNLWNICKVTSHYFSVCSSDQGTFKNAKWQLGPKCPSDNSTLKTSIAPRILTPTGGW